MVVAFEGEEGNTSTFLKYSSVASRSGSQGKLASIVPRVIETCSVPTSHHTLILPFIEVPRSPLTAGPSLNAAWQPGTKHRHKWCSYGYCPAALDLDRYEIDPGDACLGRYESGECQCRSLSVQSLPFAAGSLMEYEVLMPNMFLSRPLGLSLSDINHG